jgi:arylsulfatase A-like enzyme
MLAGSALGARQAPRRPHVVVVYTDDQGIGDLGCYGASDVKTPHLDRLARSGARFTDWYSNCPVCSPSRASLLTGKYPQRTGVTQVLTSVASFDTPGLREGEVTLAHELRKLGYRTAVVGKWHLGSAPQSRPLRQGFDEFFGFYSGWTDGYSHRYYVQSGKPQQIFHDLWQNGEEAWADPEPHTELFSRKAKDVIAKQSDRPFFLYLAYGAPHYPMIAPRKYLDRFPPGMDRDRRMHAAMLAMIDDGVGMLLDELRARNLERDTIVIFQSDNGATRETRADHAGRPYAGGSNAPFRGYKAGLFEGGIRMPTLMSWPGRIPAGQVVRGMGAAMDILPTVLGWAGGAAPAGLDGVDVGSMIVNGAASPHEALFWEYSKQSAVRAGDWKLIVNPPSSPGDPVTDAQWLSNLKDDPGEKRNRIQDEPRIARQLQQRLETWKKSVAGRH